MISMRSVRSSSNILFFVLEIERNFHQLHNEQRLVNMVEPQRRTLGNFALPDITENYGGTIPNSHSLTLQNLTQLPNHKIHSDFPWNNKIEGAFLNSFSLHLYFS